MHQTQAPTSVPPKYVEGQREVPHGPSLLFSGLLLILHQVDEGDEQPCDQ